jgi:hypothetical protein
MNIYTNIPYVYRIRWSKTGMNYVGVRYAKDCHPSELFINYFTSSKHVKKYIKEHGIPDIIEIRKTFTSEDRVNESRIHEHHVLRRLKASSRSDYLNRTDNKSIAPEHRGKSPFDMTIYEFTHSSGNTEYLTRHEMMKKYNIRASRICELIKGKIHRVNGWRLPWSLSDEELSALLRKNRELTLTNIRTLHSLPERREARIRGQNKLELKVSRSNDDLFIPYNFIHTSGIQEHLTRSDLLSKYQLDKGALLRLVKGLVKSHKGWSLQ